MPMEHRRRSGYAGWIRARSRDATDRSERDAGDETRRTRGRAAWRDDHRPVSLAGGRRIGGDGPADRSSGVVDALDAGLDPVPGRDPPPPWQAAGGRYGRCVEACRKSSVFHASGGGCTTAGAMLDEGGQRPGERPRRPGGDGGRCDRIGRGFEPNPTGRYLAYGVAEAGSEWQLWRPAERWTRSSPG